MDDERKIRERFKEIEIKDIRPLRVYGPHYYRVLFAEGNYTDVEVQGEYVVILPRKKA